MQQQEELQRRVMELREEVIQAEEDGLIQTVIAAASAMTVGLLLGWLWARVSQKSLEQQWREALARGEQVPLLVMRERTGDGPIA